MSSECDFINRELSENTSSASTTDKAARGTSRGARPDPTRIAELAMHVTIARTPAAVITRRTVPAQRRTRTAPVVVAASSPEGVPKMAPDERRRAPAAVATAAAAIVASTVMSPLAAHRYARTGSRPDAEPRSHRSNRNHRTDRFCHVCNRVCVPVADEIIEPAAEPRYPSDHRPTARTSSRSSTRAASSSRTPCKWRPFGTRWSTASQSTSPTLSVPSRPRRRAATFSASRPRRLSRACDRRAPPG